MVDMKSGVSTVTYTSSSQYAREIDNQVMELNRLKRKGIANMEQKPDTLMNRMRSVTFLGICLFIAACSSQPTVAPDSTASAGGQAKDVISTAGLAAYYPFDGSANDASRNGNHGTLHGGEFVEDRFGETDSAYSLDGVDDYISVPPSKSLYVDYENSISVWLYHRTQDDQKNWYSIVEKADPERYGHSKYGMWLIGDLVDFCIQPKDLELPHWCADSETPLEPEQWHHLAAVSDGRVLRVYVDGHLEGEKDFGSRTKLSNSEYPLFIGTDLYSSNVSYVRGIIDDLRFYKRALSEAEVKALYQAK